MDHFIILTNMNNWYKFIDGILKDFRESTYTLETKYGLKGISTRISYLKSGKTKRLTQQTIKDLEEALKIKIHDEDENKLWYETLEQFEKNKSLKNLPPVEPSYSERSEVYFYPLVSRVYAGQSFLADVELGSVKEEAFLYNAKGHKCFALEVEGDSMEPTLHNGDVLLVDSDETPYNGDIVAVKLANGDHHVKRFSDPHYQIIILSSDNPKYQPLTIDKNDIISIHPVVEAHTVQRFRKR